MIELEFTSGAELMDHYKGVLQRMRRPCIPASPQVAKSAVEERIQDDVESVMIPVTVPPRRYFMAEIMAACSKHFLYSKSDLIGARRNPKLVRARHIFCWIAYHYTTKNLMQISQVANRNHSTVSYGIDKVTDNLANLADCAADIDAVVSILEGQGHE